MSPGVPGIPWTPTGPVDPGGPGGPGGPLLEEVLSCCSCKMEPICKVAVADFIVEISIAKTMHALTKPSSCTIRIAINGKYDFQGFLAASVTDVFATITNSWWYGIVILIFIYIELLHNCNQDQSVDVNL